MDNTASIMIGLQVGIRFVEDKYTKDGQERGFKLKSFIPMTADATFNPPGISEFTSSDATQTGDATGRRRDEIPFLLGRGGFVPPYFYHGHHTENQRLL